MPAYVSLIHWTDQGIQNYQDSPSRAADFTKLASVDFPGEMTTITGNTG